MPAIIRKTKELVKQVGNNNFNYPIEERDLVHYRRVSIESIIQ